MIILALIIQLIIPPNFIFKGVKPDLLLIVSVIIGLSWGMKEGAGFGFIAGLLQDLFLGGMFGIFTITKTLTAGLAGLMEGILFKEKFIFPPLIVFLLTFLHEILTILLSDKLIFEVDYIAALKTFILPEAIINAIIAFFIYYLYYRVFKFRGNNYE